MLTSVQVPVPCSFCPLSSSASMASHALGVPAATFLAKISAHLRLRPPKHVVTWMEMGTCYTGSGYIYIYILCIYTCLRVYMYIYTHTHIHKQ